MHWLFLSVMIYWLFIHTVRNVCESIAIPLIPAVTYSFSHDMVARGIHSAQNTRLLPFCRFDLPYIQAAAVLLSTLVPHLFISQLPPCLVFQGFCQSANAFRNRRETTPFSHIVASLFCTCFFHLTSVGRGLDYWYGFYVNMFDAFRQIGCIHAQDML